MPHRVVLPLLAVALTALIATPAQTQTPISTEDLQAFHPRPIGPAVTGGRVHDVEAVPSNPSVLYVASASGGVWKSVNRGQTWTPIFDTMAVSTTGDIGLSRSNPNVVYVGTGEQNNRQSTSYGNGVYRSDDGGMTWRHLGLEETRHIGKVEVHPTDPDIAYVAALGNLWTDSEERGVFKTTDGGESWEKVLYIDEMTGAVDLVIDLSNPETLYAATYQRQRRAWGFNGGGPGSGIYKTSDGGATWNELTAGIPEGDKGRIGLAIAESNPRALNAIIEHADSDMQGTYRSEDAGLTWERVNELNVRPMYYSEIFIDPSNEDRVIALATRSFLSEDGGRTFEPFAPAPTYDVGVHRDHHALWINPNDGNHMYMGGDAGMHETYDGGINFRKLNNFLISQFYAIGVDMRDPYWVYGGLQDNHSFMGPSETRRWIGIVNDDWMQNGFGDGMYWQADPRDGKYAYGTSNDGSYHRYDTETGDHLDISPEAPFGEDYRFDWTTPMMLSEHDPEVLYAAGNRLFISKDRGSSWERTEDLSRRVDRDELQIMGVTGAQTTISRNDGTGSFGEAVTLDESPLDPDILWVGFDDGNLQLSRDRGSTWTEVSGNVPGIVDGTYVSRITASFTAPGTAYATFDGHRDGDFSPYVFRTEDFGLTWTPLHQTLPSLGVANDIIEHPENPVVLFLGTEHSVFVSTNAGAQWAKMPNLPTTHYDDILIHPREKDLVLGTHGRGIWILDDTRAIAEWASGSGPVTAFSAGQGTIRNYKKDTSYRGQAEYAGTNPVDGVEIAYKLGAGSGSAMMTVTNEHGRVVRTLQVPGAEGTHRVNWDLRNAGPGVSDTWERYSHPQIVRPVDTRGPWVSPGTYTVTIEARGTSASTELSVRGDPDMPISQAMYESREQFMLEALAIQEEVREYLQSQRAAGEDTPQARLAAAARDVGGAYGALNGNGVRPGSLYPPTQSMRDALTRAKNLLAEMRGGSF